VRSKKVNLNQNASDLKKIAQKKFCIMLTKKIKFQKVALSNIERLLLLLSIQEHRSMSKLKTVVKAKSTQVLFPSTGIHKMHKAKL
jgi:hypothetical protein